VARRAGSNSAEEAAKTTVRLDRILEGDKFVKGTCQPGCAALN